MFWKYIKRAGSDTKEFFGWNKKTLTIPFLLALGMLFHSQWTVSPAAPSMKFIMWLTYTVAPVGVFAIALFFWNLACAPVRLEKEAHGKTKMLVPKEWDETLEPKRISDVRVFAEILNRKDRFSLRQAALLLADRKLTGELSDTASALLLELRGRLRDRRIKRQDKIGTAEQMSILGHRMNSYGTDEVHLPFSSAKISRKQLYDLSVELELPIAGLKP